MKIDEKKKIAFKMRKAGRSYSEIDKQLNISKSTLSYWFSGVKWSDDIKMKLESKQREQSEINIRLMNKKRKSIMIERHDKYLKEAKIEFEQLKHNSLFLIGLALYWGEGSKTYNGRVSVINSDVEMMKIIILFYRTILKIPEQKLRVELFIYADHDRESVIRYWSEQLKIDSSQFIKVQVLPSRSKKTNRKVKHGLCAAYYSNTELCIKILEWIKLLSNECGNSSVVERLLAK